MRMRNSRLNRRRPLSLLLTLGALNLHGVLANGPPGALFESGDACEILQCANPAPATVVHGTTSFIIIQSPSPTSTSSFTAAPTPTTMLLSGDAGIYTHALQSTSTSLPTTLASNPSATLDAFAVVKGRTTATYIQSEPTTFLVPTQDGLGATKRWEVGMRVESQRLGKRWMVVMETPKLEFVDIQKGSRTSTTRTLTVTETLTMTLGGQGGGAYDQLHPTTTLTSTSYITLPQSTTTTTTTATSTLTTTSLTHSVFTSISTLTSTTTHYSAPPTPTIDSIWKVNCDHLDTVVPWTSVSIPFPAARRRAEALVSQAAHDQFVAGGQREFLGPEDSNDDDDRLDGEHGGGGKKVHVLPPEYTSIYLNTSDSSDEDARGYDHAVLIRIVDAGYRAEWYHISILSSSPTTSSSSSELDTEELLGDTHTHSPLASKDLTANSDMYTNIHCGSTPYPSEREVQQCIEMGFTEGTFLVPKGTKEVRVRLGASLREHLDDYSTIYYTITSFCDYPH